MNHSGNIQDLELLGLDDLPEGWTYMPLGELVDSTRGISYGIVQPGSYTENGTPIVRVNNLQNGRIIAEDILKVSLTIEEKYQRTRLRGGEVLLSLVGSLGQTSVVPSELKGWNVARAVAVIPVLPKFSPEWVHYSLRSPQLQHYIWTWATTTVQATLNLGDVVRLPIPIPPEKDRQAIIEILGALDDKIELNRRMNRTLESMARAVFRQWFVESEEVVGWEVGKLGDIADNIRRSVQPEQIQPETPYIGLEHMPRGSIALSEWDTASTVVSNKYLFNQDEFLFGKLRPYFHKVGVAPLDGVSSTDILVVAPKEEDYYGVVLGHISSVELINYTNAASTGTKMPRTNWSDIARYEIALPPKDKAKEFSDFIKPVVQLIRSNIMQSRTLASLRDTLLPKLMRGEVRVKV